MSERVAVNDALRHMRKIVGRVLVQCGMDGGDEDPPEPDYRKLKGDPEYGDRLLIVWDDRYEGWDADDDEPPTHEDVGYLMGLPGIEESSPDMGGIVHIPQPVGADGPVWITMLDLLLLPDVLSVAIAKSRT